MIVFLSCGNVVLLSHIDSQARPTSAAESHGLERRATVCSLELPRNGEIQKSSTIRFVKLIDFPIRCLYGFYKIGFPTETHICAAGARPVQLFWGSRRGEVFGNR